MKTCISEFASIMIITATLISQVTNAAGGLERSYNVGDIVVINDVSYCSMISPLLNADS